MSPIYLDHNATTPIAPEVAEVMRPFLDEYFGNPSSTHAYGVTTKLAVEKARGQVAELIGCDSSEIIFTSGGTESNNYAIKGAAYAGKNKGNHIITTTIEHPAVFEVCRYLEKNGFEVSYIGVDKYGMVDPDDIRRAIRPETILVTVMHANNEVGTIQPISRIAEITRKHRIVFHTDAAQSAGKIETRVESLGVDLLSIAGHKLYAPKGIGALYIKSGIELEKLIHGADHEQNLRAGTENVLEIAGLGKACEIALKDLDKYQQHYTKMRDELFGLIKRELPDVRLNGHPEKRLPNTLSISFPNIEANTLVARLDNVAASAGAACHSETIDVSAVLSAMKVPIEFAMGTIRLSTGRDNTLEEMKLAANEITNTVRSLMPATGGKSKIQKKEQGKFRLTQYTHGLGCACKIQPDQLEKILSSIPFRMDEKIIVGTETSDDAAVYRINKETAIVQSLDFFTPIVDDPYDFGSIAAANALSDIYAMGATPLFAMNIVAFPENTLPITVLQEILKGAADKAGEAGISIIGGHSIEDPEPKYGMVVTGIIHPEKVIRNSGSKPGDMLILTKPLGTGILSTAIKRGMVSGDLQQEVIALMSSLNADAAAVMSKFTVNACTDITGFGMLGHLLEMCRASSCNAELQFEKLPFIREVSSFATAGVIPGGTYKNLDFVKKHVDFGSHSRTRQLMMSDAQTSGGLLISIPEKEAETCISEMIDKEVTGACIIGSFTAQGPGKITIS
ncbi:MAG: selenide, water dikinase SelD [Bacteroidales bacterium]|nr:selenide, water dikinase SelD [Bacteroidales bacterium]